MASKHDHAQAFLDALWPCGEHSHLASHARTFLAARIGKVPKEADASYTAEAERLRALGLELMAIGRDFVQIADGAAGDPF